jgi:hypothetical protein
MRASPFLLVSASLGLAGCGVVGLADPNYAHITQGDARSTIRLVSDSSKVRALIASEAARSADEGRIETALVRQGQEALEDSGRNLARYFPDRAEFLDTMASEPGINVPGGSYARFLESSNARCGRQGVNQFTYGKVRITTGPRAGAESWACFISEVSPTFP